MIDDIAVVPTYDVPSKADAEKGKKPEIVPDSFAIYDVATGAAIKYHEVMGRGDKIMSFETEIEAKVAAMRMAEAKGYSDNVKRLLAEDPYQEIEELDKPKPEEPKTKPEEPKGGPTLRGSVLGMDVAAQAARIAVEKNVLPILKNANVSLHEILAIAKNWIAPRFGVPTDALDAVMRLIGDRAKAQYLMQETMAGIKKAFSEMPQEDQVDFIDRYKAGEEQVTPELETVAEMYRKSDEERYALKQQYRESLPHKEDHFRVFWKVIPGSQGEKVKLSPGQKVRWKDANNEEWIEGTVQSVNNAAKKVTVKPKDGEPLTLDRNQVFKAGGLGAILGRRPLQGSMGWAKKSTLASISEGLLMGGEPFTYNPQELFEMSVADDMKFITAQEMWSQIGDLGYRKFVREGQAPPEGYARLDDRLARVYFPATVTTLEVDRSTFFLLLLILSVAQGPRDLLFLFLEVALVVAALDFSFLLRRVRGTVVDPAVLTNRLRSYAYTVLPAFLLSYALTFISSLVSGVALPDPLLLLAASATAALFVIYVVSRFLSSRVVLDRR